MVARFNVKAQFKFIKGMIHGDKLHANRRRQCATWHAFRQQRAQLTRRHKGTRGGSWLLRNGATGAVQSVKGALRPHHIFCQLRQRDQALRDHSRARRNRAIINASDGQNAAAVIGERLHPTRILAPKFLARALRNHRGARQPARVMGGLRQCQQTRGKTSVIL